MPSFPCSFFRNTPVNSVPYAENMNTVSAALSPAARQLFPLLDPTVGRAVGAYLQFQKNEGKPEHLRLDGNLDDGDPNTPDAVSLSIQRDAEGTVHVTGSYAGAPVEVQIAKDVQAAFRPKDNLIWGQAGVSTEKSQAQIQGQVGPYPVAGYVHTYRKEVNIDMTPELEQSGKSIYVLPFALAVTPTFGGAPARVNGLPGDAPTNSRPLETTDRTSIEGRVGETRIAREQNWVTTTWTVSTNVRDGGSRIEMKQAESASEREIVQQPEGQTQTERQLQVASGRSASGPDRAYVLDFGKGVVSADLSAEDHHLALTLTPA
jgi:hypothetical protein